MCDACVLMHFYPSKRLWHHFSNYSLQNAVSETQCPKTKSLGNARSSKSSKILHCRNSQSLQYANTTQVFKKICVKRARFGVGGGWNAKYKRLYLQVLPILESLGKAGTLYLGSLPLERTRKWNAKESETTWVLVHSTIHLLIGIRKSFPLSAPYILPL